MTILGTLFSTTTLNSLADVLIANPDPSSKLVLSYTKDVDDVVDTFYSVDGGINFTQIGTLSESKDVLLPPNITHVKFAKRKGSGTLSTIRLFKDCSDNFALWNDNLKKVALLDEQDPVPVLNVSSELIVTRDAVASDNGLILKNLSGNNYVLTLLAALPVDFSLSIVQGALGTVTLAPGAGVTFIGASLATANAGDLLSVTYVDTDSFIVKLA